MYLSGSVAMCQYYFIYCRFSLDVVKLVWWSAVVKLVVGGSVVAVTDVTQPAQ